MINLKKVLIFVIIVLLSISCAILIGVWHENFGSVIIEIFTFNRLPLIVGGFTSLSILIGTIYLWITKRFKSEYKTYPIYAISALLEGIGATIRSNYKVFFIFLGFLLILIAISIDVRKKTGLYQYFFVKNKKDNNSNRLV